MRAAWEGVFGVRVGPDDDFFSLGGNSLLVVRLSAALRAPGFPRIALREIYLNPTVSRLAAVFDEAVTGRKEAGMSADARSGRPLLLLLGTGSRIYREYMLRGAAQDVRRVALLRPGAHLGAPHVVGHTRLDTGDAGAMIAPGAGAGPGRGADLGRDAGGADRAARPGAGPAGGLTRGGPALP